MRVIMLRSFKSLGAPGTVVNVKPGYAKNYLIPLKIASYATAEQLSKIEELKKELIRKDEERRKLADVVKVAVEQESFIIVRAAGDDSRLYGSVGTADIVDAANKHIEKSNIGDFQIQRGGVNLGFGIKVIGIHYCNIHLHGEVYAKIKINVARSVADAESNEQKLVDTGKEKTVEGEQDNSIGTTSHTPGAKREFAFDSEKAARVAEMNSNFNTTNNNNIETKESHLAREENKKEKNDEDQLPNEKDAVLSKE